MRTDALDYPLPPEAVATRPVEPRDAARMLVVWHGRADHEHARVRDLPGFLARGDTLVFNTTAVAPARLVGRRATTGGRVEGLFLAELAPGRWRVMLESNGRLRRGDAVALLDPRGAPAAELRLEASDDDGWIVTLAEPRPAAALLADVGRTPLPPYIRKARGAEVVEDRLDRDWYETVYADPDQRESVAAPTAGLHFTPALLRALDAAGVQRREVTLHVGPGTFRPITAPTLAGHRMHAERFAVPPQTAAALVGAARVLAVGTTVVRTLESLPADGGSLVGTTDLMIAPPYRFRRVHGMLTNFHLPRSTLLALVAAMVGLERLKTLYAEAVREGYRFYSYGDAMLVLP